MLLALLPRLLGKCARCLKDPEASKVTGLEKAFRLIYKHWSSIGTGCQGSGGVSIAGGVKKNM